MLCLAFARRKREITAKFVHLRFGSAATPVLIYAVRDTILANQTYSKAVNVRALETFFWVARLGSFRAAATHLNSTPSTLSARILELERMWGVSLFERQARGVCLTSRGSDLLVETERLLGDLARLECAVDNKDSLSGTVRIGCGEIASLTWVPALLKCLTHRYPDLLIDLDVDLSINLRRKLDRGDIDIGFIVGPIQNASLQVKHLIDFEMRWMVHKSLVKLGTLVDREIISRLPIVTLSRESDLYLRLQDQFRRDDIPPERLHVCSSVSCMIQLVGEGVAAAVLPACLTLGLSEVCELDCPSPMPVVSFVSAVQRRRMTPLLDTVEKLAVDTAAGWKP
jgi:DNA-binding transcriptional LysR family regulator